MSGDKRHVPSVHRHWMRELQLQWLLTQTRGDFVSLSSL